jgi:threonine-phosphate decarboxylase
MTESLPAHGGQLYHLAERFGIPASTLLDFSANINPEGPPATVLSTLRASLDNPSDLSILTSYPDIEEGALKRSIALYAGVRPANVVVANGFVPLLQAALRTLPIRRCLLPTPSFVEYRKALRQAQVEITPYLLTPESNFHYDVDTMITGQQDAILLANPQNPSGVLCSYETLLRFTARAAERNIYILLDEAFIDYLPECSLARDIDRFPNLVVFRSLTKFYGIPGLRVAYAAACPEIARSLHESLAPWLITTLASRAASAALEDEPYAKRTRLLNSRRRSLLQAQIESLGIHTYPSAANFLLLRLPALVDAAVFWQRMIVEHHIVLRCCANYEALPEGHLRAAVRTEEENSRLVHGISHTLGEFRKP